MEVRYSPDPVAYRRMTTEELRSYFLIDSLFAPDTVPMVYSDVDRSITGSCVPAKGSLKLLATKKEMAADYFLERREIGIINIGGTGSVKADGKEFTMEHKDGLYIGKGTKEVEFHSAASEAPAKFYFVSFPAHATLPTVHTKFDQAEKAKLGTAQDANKRTINKYIHPNGTKSCQLVMGLTELEEGSVWNTMPVHTHQRRSEIYMYFNLKEDTVLFHILGEPTETKHLVVRNGQAVISPSWSIHSGVATRNYSFIWAMGGENQAFDDMDWVAMRTLA
ncbi:MAG TPA: 5-dehydro-4-deoxy-D-glucuronate isomerase [Bacteroidetes bacterium]|nr:5-dehydro-4-deoxy-D-glucuronate isomerase [Bacteroidota bacterium]